MHYCCGPLCVLSPRFVCFHCSRAVVSAALASSLKNSRTRIGRKILAADFGDSLDLIRLRAVFYEATQTYDMIASKLETQTCQF